MKKILQILLFSFCFIFSVKAQPNLVYAKVIQATQKLIVTDRFVTSISNDTTANSQDSFALITEYAAKKYLKSIGIPTIDQVLGAGNVTTKNLNVGILTSTLLQLVDGTQYSQGNLRLFNSIGGGFATLKNNNSVSSVNTELDFPYFNGSATIPLSINGVYAGTNGAITIPIGTGSVTTINPGIGFSNHTPITISGILDVDTSTTVATKNDINIVNTVYNFDLSNWNNKTFKGENKQLVILPTHVDSIHGFIMADGYLWGTTRHLYSSNYLVRINPENLTDTTIIPLPQFGASTTGQMTYFGSGQITYVKSKDRLYVDCTNFVNDTIRIVEINPYTMAAAFVINKPQYITTPSAAYNKAGQSCSATDGTYLYTLNGYYDPYIWKFDLTTYKAIDSVRIPYKGLGHGIMFDGNNLYASSEASIVSSPVNWFAKLSTSPMAILNIYTSTDQSQGYTDDMTSVGDYVWAGRENPIVGTTAQGYLRRFSKKDLSFIDFKLGTGTIHSVSTDGNYVYAVYGNDTTLANEIFRIDPATNTILGHKFDTSKEKQPNEIISDGKRLWLTYFLSPAVVSRYANLYYEDTIWINVPITKFNGTITATNFTGFAASLTGQVISPVFNTLGFYMSLSDNGLGFTSQFTGAQGELSGDSLGAGYHQFELPNVVTDILHPTFLGASVNHILFGVDGNVNVPIGTGTLTSFSIVNANGFNGTVSNSTTTPALTISTPITGILKGNGTAISAAVAGTDYLTSAQNYWTKAGADIQNNNTGNVNINNANTITSIGDLTGLGTGTILNVDDINSDIKLTTNTGAVTASNAGLLIDHFGATNTTLLNNAYINSLYGATTGLSVGISGSNAAITFQPTITNSLSRLVFKQTTTGAAIVTMNAPSTGGTYGFVTSVNGNSPLSTTGALQINLTGDVTSVANATTYSNVVPSTKGGAGSINGLLKANGSGVVSQAVSGTDYQPAGNYVNTNGTTPLTDNWNTGAFYIQSTQSAATANTNYDGFNMFDTTAASSGNQMISPGSHYQGQGWKTTLTAASQPVDAWTELVPIQGTTNPSSEYHLDFSINGGSRTNQFAFSNTGTLLAQKNILSMSFASGNMGYSSGIGNPVTMGFKWTGATGEVDMGGIVNSGTFPVLMANGIEALRVNVTTRDVLIGTATDVVSSKLTVSSTTQGSLLNSMTTTQKNAIATPSTGLLVYDNVLNQYSSYTGAAWQTVGSMIQNTATSNTTIEGHLLSNTTAATLGNQQYSPYAHFQGQGWKTTATAASQSVDFRNYLVPVQGTTNPTGNLTWDASINGGSYTNLMWLNTNGFLGLGTQSAPAMQLDMLNSMNGNYGIIVKNSSSGTSAAATLVLGNGTTNNSAIFKFGGSNPGFNTFASGDLGLYNPTNNISLLALTGSVWLSGGNVTTPGLVVTSANTTAIGATSTATSSKFSVVSTTQGTIAFPVMTSAQRTAIVSPVVGLHVYQTDGSEGVYVYKSTGWMLAY